MAQVIKAERRHWPDILKMRLALYPGYSEDFHEEEMAQMSASPDWAVFVLVDEAERVVGLLELSLRNIVDGCLSRPVGYIEGIYVAPETRGRGLGRMLVEFAAMFFTQAGYREMACDALLEDTAAQAFHRQMGFEETERIVQFRMEIPREQPLPND